MAVQHKKVDVVTVGAGYTAGILAWKLTKAGHSVVSIERGEPRATYPDFQHNHDSLRNSVRKVMMINLEKESWTWRPNPKAPALPMRRYGSFHPGEGYGGSGAHWSGMLWRFLETDFKYRSHHVQRYGEQKLPAGNAIQDWPLSYQELEPYYDQFEYDIGASGQTGNLNGTILDGGNPFEAPRTRPFPLPPLATTLAADVFSDACLTLGYHPFPQPSGILSRAYTDISGRTRSGCIYCGFCTRFGCEVDAKNSAITTYFPPALATGRYELRPYSTVTKVDVGAGGLATGVRYVDNQGIEHVQPAAIVILSGYTLGNVRLLLLSRDGGHRDGIGNDRGRLGKNYTYQNWHTAIVKGVFPGRRFNLFMGNTSTLSLIYEFNADNFDHSNLDFIGGASLFCGDGEQAPVNSAASFPIDALQPSGPGSAGGPAGGAGGSGGGVGGGHGTNSAGSTTAENPTAWGQRWKDALRSYWDSVAAITMQGESLPYEDQFLDLDPTYKDAFGQPLLRLTFDWHDNDYKMVKYLIDRAKEIMRAMGPAYTSAEDQLSPYDLEKYKSTHCTGGAIMGSDPGNSVCNRYGQVWDTPNVFVTGAALYPQNPGANPTGTLCALAYLAGDAIRDRYWKHQGHLID